MTDVTQDAKDESKVFLIFYITVLLVSNGCIIYNAIDKGGWGALGLLAFVLPGIDIILFIVGIVRAITLDRKYPNMGFPALWLFVVFTPLVLIAVSLGVLFSGVTGGGC